VVTFAFSIFGLSETLSVILIFAAGLAAAPLLFFAWFFLSEWWTSRTIRRRSDWRDEMSHPEGLAESGLLLCDYVDERTLASIAKQKGIEPEPNRRERGTATSRGGDIGAGFHGARAGLFRKRDREEREYFDVEKDPNAVLGAVLRRLERDGELDRTVGNTPFLPLDQRTLELVRDAQEGQPVGDDVVARLVRAEKRQEFDGIVERSPVALIESEWRVDVTGAVVSMSLRLLRPGYLAYDRYGPGRDAVENTQPTPVPDGLSISASFPTEGLTDPVKTRLTDGAVVNAGMLATVSAYRGDGRLELAPIAVFGRHGALR
jgi:hypothetical protein